MTALPGPAPAAVLVDLDDTLYPQAAWLTGAWAAVARAGARAGLDGVRLLAALRSVAEHGSDRGRIVDRALAAIGVPPARAAGLVPGLVATFRAYRADRLDAYPGVVAELTALRTLVPVGVVTDGDPHIQRGKLAALGLTGSFDVVVYSDERRDAADRPLRKPHPDPFRRALAALAVPAGHSYYVGDRPDKDVAGALAAGLQPIRVRSGEYAALPDTDSLGGRPVLATRDARTALAVLRRAVLASRHAPDG